MGSDARAGGGASAARAGWPGLQKRSFSLSGHRTSVALETEFWTVLAALADKDGVALSVLVGRVDAVRVPGQPLASALRLAALLGGK
ncbi:MAG TPA: ribbon-helix-helix domain-containing protein [Acetobacteraceae bacterium]